MLARRRDGVVLTVGALTEDVFSVGAGMGATLLTAGDEGCELPWVPEGLGPSPM